MRHISDSERLVIASLNRKEEMLKETEQKLKKANDEIETLRWYIGELRDSNKILSNQVRYLVSKHFNHENTIS